VPALAVIDPTTAEVTYTFVDVIVPELYIPLTVSVPALAVIDPRTAVVTYISVAVIDPEL
jgi:hypothetical protein